MKLGNFRTQKMKSEPMMNRCRAEKNPLAKIKLEIEKEKKNSIKTTKAKEMPKFMLTRNNHLENQFCLCVVVFFLSSSGKVCLSHS